MTRFAHPSVLLCVVAASLLALPGCAWQKKAEPQTKLFEIAPAKEGSTDEIAPAIAALDEGKLPANLQKRFNDLGVELPAAQPVEVAEPGVKWTFSAKAGELFLTKEGPKLVAYKQGGPLPQRVLYVTPATESVTEFEEFTGRTAATEVIELRARVSGYLDKLHFEDGEEVVEDQPLFTIDDRPFIAEEKRTAAAVAQYEARIKRLESQEKRSKTLFDKQAISQDEYETIKYDLAEARATLDAAKASHETARLNLDFTKVTAPTAGRIGRRMVDVGNLVTADVTMLATIVPLEKVYVYFDMDERTVLKLRRLEHRGMISSAMKEDVTVNIALADSEEFALTGTIDFLDNQVDPATGTLRVRATVENPDDLLSPGLFVRLRYPIGKAEPSMIIPEESLGSDQGRPFVYIINDENKIEARNVELGPQVGPNRVIREGLSDGERIAVTGLQRLRRNVEVAPQLRVPEPKETKTPEALAADKKHKSAKATKVSVGHGAE